MTQRKSLVGRRPSSRSYLTTVVLALATGIVSSALHSTANAQVYVDPNCQIVNQTYYEPQQVTTYRLEYETVLEERQVTTMRPVIETQTRRRRVAKPVVETHTREERYTVLRPVTTTETRYQQYTVRKPVSQTVMRDQNYVTYEPVTTMRTQYVDRGSYVDQPVYTPGAVRNRLQWLPGGYVSDPVTGTAHFQRGGLHWVPTQAPGAVTVQRQYVPNVVACQVPQTTYQQKVVTQKVPVTVTSYVDEVVQQPVQVQVCKWEQQPVVRQVPYTTQRIQWEEEPYEVRVQKMVPETKTVQVPHTVAKWVPQVTTRMVPKTVTMRVQIDPCQNLVPNTTYYGGSYSPYVVPSSPVQTTDRPVIDEEEAGQDSSGRANQDDGSEGSEASPSDNTKTT